MKQILRVISIILVSTALAACNSRSANLVTPVEQPMADGVSGGNLQFDFNPKVDILFVIDDSMSEKEEHVKLQDAANDFVDSFGENNLIDYRVGVMSIYDSTRCNQLDKNGNPRKCHPEGVLRSPYVSRGDGAKKQIHENINIGILPLDPVAPEVYSGPEYDELFNPILMALSPQGNHQNGDFIRPDSQIVIVMLDDEDDYSGANLSVDEFLQQMYQFAGDRVSLYGVLTRYIDTSGAIKDCPRSKWASPPRRLMSAIQQTNGKIFPICDAKYGKYLGSIGSDIRKRALNQDIILKSIPEAGTIKLSYGGVNIPAGQGWSYNPRTQTISINEKINVNYDPSAHFDVNYIKVENSAILKGRAKPAPPAL